MTSLPARELLKQATQLKKQRLFADACDKLREAYAAPDAQYLMIEDRLRLPMYLQLAGRNDEGWKVLSELNVKYADVFSQPLIAKQCRVFLEKEGKMRDAVTWAAWEVCRELERDRGGKAESEALATGTSEIDREIESLSAELRKAGLNAFADLGRGSREPGSDAGAGIFAARIDDNTSVDGIASRLSTLLKKQKAADKAEQLATRLAAYVNDRSRYDFRDVSRLIAATLGENDGA